MSNLTQKIIITFYFIFLFVSTKAVTITSIQVSPSDCQASGTATVNATGGTAPYLYAVNIGGTLTAQQSSNIINSLPAGTHTVVVTDLNGFTAESVITITGNYQTLNFTPVASYTGGCASGSGIITVNITSGTGKSPFVYQLVAPSPVTTGTQTSNSFSGLNSGNYSVKVFDACGNFQTRTVAIATSASSTGSITISPYALSIINCNTASNQIYFGNTAAYSVTITSNNGSANTTFIEPTNGATHTFTFTPYTTTGTVTAVDACGSVFTQTFSSVVTPTIAVGLINTGSGCQSYAQLYTTNLVGPYTATLSNSGGVVSTTTSATNINFPSQSNGVYTVTLTDNCGRTAVKSFTWINGAENIYVAVAPDASACPSLKYTGSVGNGTPSYTVYLSNGTSTLNTTVTTQTLSYSGYPDGTYTLTAMDQCGNTATNTINWSIASIAPTLNFQPSSSRSSTCLDSTGSVRVYMSGLCAINPSTISIVSGPLIAHSNNPNYSYSYNYTYPITYIDSTTTGYDCYFYNLAAGTYSITYKDANGSTTSNTVVIGSVASMATSQTTYSLSYIKGCTSNTIIAKFISTPTTSPSYNASRPVYSIPSGTLVGNTTYVTSILYTSGTWPGPGPYPGFGTRLVTIRYAPVPAGDYSIGNVLGSGISGYNYINATGFCSSNTGFVSIPPYVSPKFSQINKGLCQSNKYTVQAIIDSTSGIGPYQYSVISGPQTYTAQSSNTFTFSQSGVYTLLVSDACGNSYNTGVSLDTAKLIINNTGKICLGSTMKLYVVKSPFFSYKWKLPGGSFYSGDTLTINPVTITDYGTYLIDQYVNINGCKDTVKLSKTINPSIPPTFSSGVSCSGTTATITATGATSYTWFPIVTYNEPLGSSVSASPTVSTVYTVTSVSTNSCVYTSTASISVSSSPTINILSIGSGSTICAGKTTTIMANGAASYTIIPNNITNTSGIFTVSPTTQTTYSIIGISASGCGGNIAIATVSNIPTPTIAIASISSNSICSSNSATITPSGANTYTLMSNTTTLTSIPFILSPTISTTYTIVGTSTANCASNNNVTTLITVNTTPTVIAVFSSNAICSSQNVTITLSGANSGYTLNPSNTPISATTSSIVISPPPGTTIYTITANNTNGCVSTLANQIYTTSVSVVTNPTITVSSITSSICAGATASITPFGATTFTLMPGNITVNSGQTFTLTPTIPTTYTINGTATGGCVSIASTQFVTTIGINANPIVTIASVSNPTICAGNNSTITPSGANTYTLTSSTTTLTSSPFVVSPLANTTYTIIGSSSANCLSGNTIQQLITVNTTPTVSILSASNPTICSGNSSTITPNGATSYTLVNTGATGTSFNVSPTSNTTYTIIGASSANCTSNNNAQQLITVNATPTITAIGPASGTICSGAIFTITPSGASANSYTLTPGNIVSASSFTVVPNTTTTYTINGSNTSGCSSTAITDLNVPVSVNASPSVTAVFSSNALCASQNVTISLAGANANYTLNPGNTIISAGTASAVITPTAGTTNYTITGNNVNGCVSVLASQIYTTSVSVVTNPTITVSAITSSICAGATASMTPFGATTFTLIPGNISIASGQTFTLTPSSNTSYTINGTATGGCMSIPSTQFVTTIGVNQNPTITAVSVLGNTLCTGLSTTLTASGANSYTWASGPNTPDYVVSPSATTIYTVTGTDINGCSNNDAPTSFTLVVANSLSVIVTNTLPASCGLSNGSVTLTTTGGSPVYTYSWVPVSASSYTTLASTNGSLSIGTTTVYVIDGNGCITNTTINITNPNAPVLTSTVTNIICYGTSTGVITTEVVSSSACTYTWSNNTYSADLSGVVAGVYTVTIQDGSLCSSTQIIAITQPSVAMSLQISNLINACQNQSNGSATVVVSGGTPLYTYTWQPIINNTNVLSNVPIGNYTIQATDINGCKTNTIVTIPTSTNPVIASINNITPATCNQNNGSITIDVTGGGPLYTYQWLPTNNFSQNLENILAGNYTVIVTDNTGCMDSLTLTLDCKVAIFIPTLFSPNGDGKNDLFEIKGTENYPNNNISIFNRWGNLIYSKKKYDNTFDGKANVSNSIGNGLLPSGTYFVVFDFGDETTPPYKGYLELKY